MESIQPQDAAELEQHLRDSTAALLASGLNEEEAFLIASRRMGEYHALGQEFCKINGSYVWTRRVFWMLAGYLIMHLSSLSIAGIVSCGQLVTAMVGGKTSVLAGVSIGLSVVCWIGILLTFCYWAFAGLDASAWLHSLRRISGTMMAVAFVVLIAASGLVKLVSQAALARFTSMETFGTAVLASAYANAALALFVPLACILIMLSLRRRMQMSQATAT